MKGRKVMTKKELKTIVSKWIPDIERAVDWDIVADTLFSDYMVRVITISKHHSAYRRTYWVHEDGSIDWDNTHTDILL